MRQASRPVRTAAAAAPRAVRQPRPTPARHAAGDPDFMQSLARGLDVLRAFGGGRAQLSIGDVARVTGLSRAAARRCLYTLTTLGYATSADGRYELTPAVL